MKVLYDYQAFTMQHFGGVSKCFCELIRRFPPYINYEISIVQSQNEHLKGAGLVNDIQPVRMDKQIFLQKFGFRGSNKLWENVLMNVSFFRTAEKVNMERSIARLSAKDWDVFHPTFFNPYFLQYIGEKPYVVTVHDMISELYLKLGLKKQSIQKKKVLENASAIIAVSENTKKDLCDILKIPEKKVHVIYHGGPKQETIFEAPLFSNKYILFIGNRNGYKMFSKLLSEFSVFYRHHPDIKLVCTGKPFSSEEVKQMQKWRVNDAVTYLGATDVEMKNLYANALAFIYPSEYEGFGMPILEAYAYGCPVLLNRKSCFPEIAADAALYFDTSEDNSILKALKAINNYSTDLRNQLIEKGYQRLANFSWEKSANQLIDIYKTVI